MDFALATSAKSLPAFISNKATNASGSVLTKICAAWIFEGMDVFICDDLYGFLQIFKNT